MRCGVALAFDLDGGGGFFESAHIFSGEFEGCAAQIFFEPRKPGRTWNRNDPWLFCQQPCESDLRRRGFLLFREMGDYLDERLIGFAIFFAEAWDDVAEVGAVELGGGVDLAGEEASAQRAEGHETDAEFFERGHNGLFRLAPEQRVLTLQCRDGLHCVSAADGFCACFGKANMLYLACLNQVFDCAGGLFDGSVGVDAMLVKEVDSVGFKTFERGFDDLPDVLGTAVEGCPLTAVLGIGLKAELGGDDDLVAERSESFARDFFVDVGTVDFGGIEESDAALDGGADELDGF